MMVFFLNLPIKFENGTAPALCRFFIDCKTANEEALLVINSSGGDLFAVNQVAQTYQDSGVHLTTIGLGDVSNMEAVLFCMADERILVPNTCFEMVSAGKEYYLSKTNIPENILNEKCENNSQWKLTEEEIAEYGITTRSSDGWLDLIAQNVNFKPEVEPLPYFSVNDKIVAETTYGVLEYIIECKNLGKEAIFLISSPGGLISQEQAIREICREAGINLTTIGVGQVASAAATIFCLGDRRILVPKTQFLLHHSLSEVVKKPLPLPNLSKICISMQMAEERWIQNTFTKTKITREIFEAKCRNGKNWELAEEEIEKYGITTEPSAGWTSILADAVNQAKRT